MRITLTDAGKRFNRDWIFRHLHYEFTAGRFYAVTGPNGSGKSTLLQAIAGSLTISEGAVRYETTGEAVGLGSDAGRGPRATPSRLTISHDQVYRYLSLSAPYLELIEEMTLTEFLRFHQAFKPLLAGFDTERAAASVGLGAAMDKQIRYFSSGMRQRVKLAQALFSDTPVVLLDEPCTNLDAEGIALYRRLVAEHGAGRLLIISSNDPQEYDFCTEVLNISAYKASNPAKAVT